MATVADGHQDAVEHPQTPARKPDPRLIDFFFRDNESQPYYTNIDPRTGQPIDPSRPTHPPTSTWEMLKRVLLGRS